MFKQTQGKRSTSVLAIVAASLIIAACGGEEDDKKSSGSSGGGGGVGAGLLCFAYLLVSGDDGCLSYVGSSSGGSNSSSSGGNNTSTGGSDTPIAFRPIDEYEPNNSRPNANVVQFPRTTDRDGFIADGAVNDVQDQADFYTFTRTFLRYHAFRLCSNGQKFCDSYGEIDTLTAYIDVLDQFGNVLASTQASDSNYIRIQLNGGVPHFVRVVAGDTMAATVQYHLVVHEANY